MIPDYADMHFTAPAPKLESIRSDNKSFNLSVSVDDEGLCAPLKGLLKKLTSTSDLETVPLHEARLLGALWKQEELLTAIAVKEHHITSLQKGLDNWEAMTESARQELGRYHTREEVHGTLRYEEESLRCLKYKINSVEHQIKVLRGVNDAAVGIIRVTEDSQGQRSAEGNREVDTDEEVDKVLG